MANPDFNATRRFSRYVSIINEQSIFFSNVTDDGDRINLEDTIIELGKLIPELSELSTVLASIAATQTTSQSAKSPKSQTKRIELRDLSHEFHRYLSANEVQVSSDMARHFFFFGQLELSDETIVNTYQEIMSENDTVERWRFPEPSWTVERIRPVIILSEKFLLKNSGQNEVEPLAKVDLSSQDERRSELQEKYRDELIAQGVGTKRTVRIPSTSELVRISDSLLKNVLDLPFVEQNAESESLLTEETDAESSTGERVIDPADFIRLVANEADCSLTLTDFVIHTMSWGARGEVRFDLESLINFMRYSQSRVNPRKLFVSGVQLHLRRGAASNNIEAICSDIEKYYLNSVTTDASDGVSQEVSTLIDKSVGEAKIYLERYKKRFEESLKPRDKKKQFLTEYLKSLDQLTDSEQLQSFIRHQLLDELAVTEIDLSK